MGSHLRRGQGRRPTESQRWTTTTHLARSILLASPSWCPFPSLSITLPIPPSTIQPINHRQRSAGPLTLDMALPTLLLVKSPVRVQVNFFFLSTYLSIWLVCVTVISCMSRGHCIYLCKEQITILDWSICGAPSRSPCEFRNQYVAQISRQPSKRRPISLDFDGPRGAFG